MRRFGIIGLKGALAGAALIAGLGGPALGGEAQDRLFGTGVLKDLPVGETLVYDFERKGDLPADKLPVVDQGSVRLKVNGKDDVASEIIVSLDDKRHVSTYDPFPPMGGNPVFMVFMEQNVAAMSAITGGSPFYIRNRMREALGRENSVTPVDVTFDGATVAGRQLTFHPFATDANRDRMGAFADLAITFTLSDGVPGTFASMEAVTGPGEDGQPVMRMTMDLDHVEKAN